MSAGHTYRHTKGGESIGTDSRDRPRDDLLGGSFYRPCDENARYHKQQVRQQDNSLGRCSERGRRRAHRHRRKEARGSGRPQHRRLLQARNGQQELPRQPAGEGLHRRRPLWAFPAGAREAVLRDRGTADRQGCNNRPRLLRGPRTKQYHKGGRGGGAQSAERHKRAHSRGLSLRASGDGGHRQGAHIRFGRRHLRRYRSTGGGRRDKSAGLRGEPLPRGQELGRGHLQLRLRALRGGLRALPRRRPRDLQLPHGQGGACKAAALFRALRGHSRQLRRVRREIPPYRTALPRALFRPAEHHEKDHLRAV